MRIGILDNKKSYLPEKFAYSQYLQQKNFDVLISYDMGELEKKCNWVILFMGFYPLKKKQVKYIHDYNSLSAPPFENIKNLIKKKFNFIPDVRFYNSYYVKQELNFNDNIKSYIRSAGIDEFFLQTSNTKKEYDIVYSGSNRPGLKEELKKFLDLGFSILVLGKFDLFFRNYFSDYKKKIEIIYISNRYELPKYYQKCQYGLNYIPDIKPFNLQNSLKLIEYCASNLKILSSDNYFAKDFELKNNGKFFYTNQLLSKSAVETFEFNTPCVKHLIWKNILLNLQFEKIFE